MVLENGLATDELVPYPCCLKSITSSSLAESFIAGASTSLVLLLPGCVLTSSTLSAAGTVVMFTLLACCTEGTIGVISDGTYGASLQEQHSITQYFMLNMH